MQKAGPSCPSAWPHSAIAIIWSWHHGAMSQSAATPSLIWSLHAASSIPARRAYRNLGSRCGCRSRNILLLPFVQNYFWCGHWPRRDHSVVAFLYRLLCLPSSPGAKLARPAPAAIALIFSRLIPIFSTCAQRPSTEPLQVRGFIWIVVWLVEWRSCTSTARLQPRNHRLQLDLHNAFRSTSLPLSSPPSSRVTTARSSPLSPGQASDSRCSYHAAPGDRGRLGVAAFWLPSLAVVAAPLLWLAYSRQLRLLRRLALFCARAISRLTLSSSTPPLRARRRCILAGTALGCAALLPQSL